ncbi:MAG: rRNA maturation RNase YbeY [Phycisphaerales bacterium]|nr:MAG: rRNA maturation RNase YbeY [Phycisphaerales bacterium]
MHLPAQDEDEDIVVQIARDFKQIRIRQAGLRDLVRRICRRYKLKRAVVGIAIVGDARIRKLNRRFLARSSTSDCLSFDLSDNKGPRAWRCFELVVNGAMAVRQARARGHSGQAELALYVTHALLHNLGFDDSTKRRARRMHDIEDQILQEAGYGSVYNTGRG